MDRVMYLPRFGPQERRTRYDNSANRVNAQRQKRVVVRKECF